MFTDFTNGLYVGCKFDEQTLDAVKGIQDSLDLPNKVSRDDIHCTIVYSRKTVPYVVTEYPVVVASKGYLKTFSTEKGNCLVLALDSDYLKQRHQYGDILGATYDFDEYIPHITLSYDIGPLVYTGEYRINVVATHEYKEELDLNWQAITEHIERRGSNWVVLNKSKTKVLGTHGSKEKALAQLAAIEINKN